MFNYGIVYFSGYFQMKNSKLIIISYCFMKEPLKM